MADETPSEPKMTPRERRAANAKTSIKPETKKYLVRAVVAVVAIAAVYGIYASVISNTKDTGCPDHWHATFGIFVPGAGGSPQQVDFASPRADNGGAYYEMGGYSGMTGALHMHQSGGSVDPFQLHIESGGVCNGVQETFEHLEARLASDSIRLSGGHAQVGQDGTWKENETAKLRFWVQGNDGAWDERSWGEVKGYQLKDGESILVAFGAFSDFQIQNMQKGIPPPVSRGSAGP